MIPMLAGARHDQNLRFFKACAADSAFVLRSYRQPNIAVVIRFLSEANQFLSIESEIG